LIATSDLVRTMLDVADELNETLPQKIAVDRGADAPLYGRDGVLDSLALVSFVAAAEQAIEERFGVTVSLADERAVSQKSSPFRTIGTLVEYVLQQSGGAA